MTVEERRALVKADGKLQALCAKIRSRLELETVLDADDQLRHDPELRAGVVSRILALVPRLRAN
jgi:hypothetical protein